MSVTNAGVATTVVFGSKRLEILRSLLQPNCRNNSSTSKIGNCDLQCWRCNKFSCPQHVFCDSCHTIQPVSPKNDYFSYMGVNRKFLVNESDLKNRFRTMQSVIHPDKYGQCSKAEQEYSQQHSSYLNQAYRTLRDPLTRANYLLGSLDQETSGSDQIDQEYAMKIMELNEEVDSIEDKEQLKEKLESVDNQIHKFLSDIENSFSHNDMTDAKRVLNKMRYLKRTKELIETKLGWTDIY